MQSVFSDQLNKKRLNSEHKHYVYQQIKPNVSTKQIFVVAVDMVNKKNIHKKVLVFLHLTLFFMDMTRNFYSKLAETARRDKATRVQFILIVCNYD